MKNFEKIIPNELFKLADLFPKESPLYIVGGFIRDYIDRECINEDIDVACSLSPKEVEDILVNSDFNIFSASPRLGTIIIKGKEKRHYEYTTFRVDSYPVGDGVHLPSDVIFTKDILEDAKRRDFRCNAVYYNLNERKIVDPLLGVEDIKNKIIQTVVDPNIVLSQDGLRIMRLVRMVSNLGYKVEKKTFLAAKELKERLKDISIERIQVELTKILNGDNVLEALHLMKDIGVLKIIIPELAEGDGILQNAKYHKYDVLEHTFRTVDASPKKIRLAALFHDIAKPICQRQDGNMHNHDKVGAKIAKDILTRLKYSNDEIKFVVELVESHMFDVADNAKTNTIRKFIAKHPDNILDIVALQKADGIATGLISGPLRENRTEKEYYYMLKNNIPIKLSQLKINGDDLIKIGFKGKEVGEILKELFDRCLFGEYKNDREMLLYYAKNKYKKKYK